MDRLKEFSSIEQFMIFYDNDKTGKTGALKLAKELYKINKPIEIYNFPADKKEKYDVSDFFNDGYSVEELFNLNKNYYIEDIIEEKIEINPNIGFRLTNYILDSLDDFDFGVFCPKRRKVPFGKISCC